MVCMHVMVFCLIMNRKVVSKATYAKLDNYIYQKTFYWTMRKFHGNTRYKAMDRYFRSRSHFRRWIFSDFVKDKDGQKKYVYMH